jgi:hypothetical protein
VAGEPSTPFIRARTIGPHAADLRALDQGLGDGVAHGRGPALGDGGQDVLLAAEVLVERADADPGPLGDVVGGQLGRAIGLEKLKGRVENGVDRASARAWRGVLRCLSVTCEVLGDPPAHAREGE